MAAGLGFRAALCLGLSRLPGHSWFALGWKSSTSFLASSNLPEALKLSGWPIEAFSLVTGLFAVVFSGDLLSDTTNASLKKEKT